MIRAELNKEKLCTREGSTLIFQRISGSLHSCTGKVYVQSKIIRSLLYKVMQYTVRYARIISLMYPQAGSSHQMLIYILF